MLIFLCAYLAMMVIASILCCGWFIITRGELYIKADGSRAKYGMIFKEWSFFWERQSKSDRKVYFSNDEWYEKWKLLNKVRPDLAKKMRKYQLPEGDNRLGYTNATLTPEEVAMVEDALQCFLYPQGDDRYRAWVVEPIYVFPSWVRKPISECPVCFGSVYGSMFYWFVVSQARDIFSWSLHENLAKLGFWGIFCVILSCSNRYIVQKMKL